MKWYVTTNQGGSVRRADVPRVDYPEFFDEMSRLLADADYHIAHYFGVPSAGGLELYCILSRDSTAEVMIAACFYDYYNDAPLRSLTAVFPQVHPFEREISERYGIEFAGHPWNKPLRFPADRRDKGSIIEKYDFYRMEGESLHEVNVGPIHAGVIEPGAFRFICNGEQVLHLEIALGYQHRGVERLMQEGGGLRRALLAESIAGDSTVSHSSVYAMAVEKLVAGDSYREDDLLWRQRAIALELERMAMHISDTAALCGDIGYQLGQVACEALRTIIINTTQAWCGNRFGKNMIRPCGSNWPLTQELAGLIRKNVATVRRRFAHVRANLKATPSLLARFEQCGIVPAAEMQAIGGVGMAARASGVGRDVRATHPWGAYRAVRHELHVSEFGDVMARLTVRMREVLQSADMITALLDGMDCGATVDVPRYDAPLSPGSIAFGMVEGWRGEIVHVLLTDAEGRVDACRIKDPSVHNWLGLALAVRGEGISDFPICNKSFDLSYCGHDL